MRSALVAAAVSLSIIAIATADPAGASIKKHTDIPAQDLAPALQQFMKDRDLHLIYISEDVRDHKTRGATGELTSGEALTQILGGTNLTFSYIDDKTVTIVPISPVAKPPTEPTHQRSSTSNAPSDAAKGGESKSFWNRFRLAQVDTNSSQSSLGVSVETPESSSQKPVALEEITVTAQKRQERLQDVPVPVTAIDATVLVDSNQLRLQDYYTRIPGLNLTSQGFRDAPVVSIRGITTGPFANPIVGIVVDDLPYGASTNLGGGSLAPDIDPSELARVEVLRGPQGTLYGASSMGGLLKFVTVDPSTDQVSGRLQGGISNVHNGDEFGYTVRGSVNVPLSETLAVRASGFTRRDPGYIDNPVTGVDGINRATARGGRLSALWRPSEVFSLKLSALLQKSETDGAASVDVQPGLGDLQQNSLRGTGWSDKKTQVYSAVLHAKLGELDLTAVTGYGINRFSDSLDFTQLFGSTGTARNEDNKTTKLSQEVRLSTPLGQHVEWLLGAFYGREESEYEQITRAIDPATGAPVSQLTVANFPSTFDEYAAFTDLTFNVTDRFDVQVGGRESKNRQTYMHTVAFTGGELVNPKEITRDNAFTYLLTPRFKASPDLMVYARLASGYRPGAFSLFGALNDLPLASKPDKTQNYEIGIKGAVLEHTLSFDASLYYIDWKDIQISVVDFASQSEFYVNASRAKSQGVELSVESRPLTGLTIAAWLAWNDAELTQALPPGSPVSGVSGDRLPFSSRFSGNLSLDKEFPLAGDVSGFAGAAVSYMSARQSVFVDSPPRQTLPAHAKVDVLAGVRSDSWSASLFVNNVADKRGVLSGGKGSVFPNSFTYIQPRTVGLTLSRSF
jgi:iron complex outermembrane receptor protein